jgi:hypothetical protein
MQEMLTKGVLALALLSACRPEPNTPESALMAAARSGRLDAMRALIKSGADVNRRGRNDWPPLVHAIHKRQLAAARLLLDSGARADEVMDGGATPLMFAAAYGDTAMVEELLSRGADPHRQAANGVTALGNAAGGGPIFDFTVRPSAPATSTR